MFENIKNWVLGIEDIEDDDITQEDIDKMREQLRKERAMNKTNPSDGGIIAPPMKVSNSRVNTSDFKIIVVKPRKYEEVKKLSEELAALKPIIVDFSNTKKETAEKMFEFLSGATYILKGNIQQLNNSTFIFAASNVKLDTTEFPYMSEDGTMW